MRATQWDEILQSAEAVFEAALTFSEAAEERGGGLRAGERFFESAVFPFWEAGYTAEKECLACSFKRSGFEKKFWEEGFSQAPPHEPWEYGAFGKRGTFPGILWEDVLSESLGRVYRKGALSLTKPLINEAADAEEEAYSMALLEDAYSRAEDLYGGGRAGDAETAEKSDIFMPRDGGPYRTDAFEREYEKGIEMPDIGNFAGVSRAAIQNLAGGLLENFAGNAPETPSLYLRDTEGSGDRGYAALRLCGAGGSEEAYRESVLTRGETEKILKVPSRAGGERREVKIEVVNNNSIKGEADIDSILDALTERLEEMMVREADGLYI